MKKRLLPPRCCCVCGTTEEPLGANGYGHLFCNPCGEEHDRKVLARWQAFLTTLAEFDALADIVGGQAARCPGSIGNGFNCFPQASRPSCAVNERIEL